MSKEQLKKILKLNARTAAFKMLKEMQSTHKKVKSIKYEAYEMQSYLSSENISHGEAQTLTAFRSQCTKGIRLNFRKMYQNLECPLNCSDLNYPDSQEHILQCKMINPHMLNVQFGQVYGTQYEQEEIAKALHKLVRKRNQILEINSSQAEDTTKKS